MAEILSITLPHNISGAVLFDTKDGELRKARTANHTRKINFFLSTETYSCYSLFLHLILKKKNKHVNMVFEYTIMKTQ